MIVQGNARCNMLQVFLPEFTVRCITKGIWGKEKYRFQHAKYREWDEFSFFFFFLKQGFKLKISRLITTKIIPPIINTLITACKIAQKFYDFANRGKKVTITLMNWKRITFIKRSFWLIAWHTWGTVNKVSQTQERIVSPVYTDKEKNKGEGWFLSQIRLRHCQTRTDSPVASDHRFISDSWPQSTIHPLNYPDIRSVDTLASVHPRAHVCARILH